MTDIMSKKGGRPTKRPSAEQLAILYETGTAKDIAEEYGVAVSTVRGWIRKVRAMARSEEVKK